MKNQYTLRFISDAGHGWLEIPNQLYKELGIKATTYSYYSKTKDNVYLEEDCDASKAMRVLEEKGIEVTLEYVNYNGDCFIRRLNHLQEAQNDTPTS